MDVGGHAAGLWIRGRVRHGCSTTVSNLRERRGLDLGRSDKVHFVQPIQQWLWQGERFIVEAIAGDRVQLVVVICLVNDLRIVGTPPWRSKDVLEYQRVEGAAGYRARRAVTVSGSRTWSSGFSTRLVISSGSSTSVSTGSTLEASCSVRLSTPAGVALNSAVERLADASIVAPRSRVSCGSLRACPRLGLKEQASARIPGSIWDELPS